MPARVRVVLALLGLYALLAFIGLVVSDGIPVQGFVSFALGVVFVVFLARGHPLARQWAQYIALILALVAVIFATSFLRGAPPASAFGLVLSSVFALLLFWGLSGSEARKFFDLYCGHCRSFKVRAKGLLFNRIRCRKCGRVWKVHDPRVDADVFD